ncbi:hypothetical protein AFR_12450 [Actinoplanes friuliensis DSM 7358]|uniref:Gram-positive cocci surface proteins LPxTG domain-containing protein n=1 Tax=Actinoplanes friuliensis DSM 7358 TaxID=1246995 RepID=U5VYN7_9ACTN|nr:hypothetical protein AFR_12450 [Actinoplanes friuliensis DSM 7358]
MVMALLVSGVAAMGAARAPEDRTLYLIAPDQAPIGHTAELLFQARGITSDEEADGLVLTLTLPGGMTYVSPEPYAHHGSNGNYNDGPCTPSGQIVTCRIDRALIGSDTAAWTATVGIDADVAPGTRLTVRVGADGKTLDATSTAVAGADLTVRVEPPKGSVTAGQPVEFTAIVRNNGPATIQRFTLFESYEGLWYGGGRVTNPEADCFSDPGSFICDVYREVKPGEEVRLQHSMQSRANADTWGTRNHVGLSVEDVPSKIDDTNDGTSFQVQFSKKPPQSPSPTPSRTQTTAPDSASPGGGGGLPITGPASLPLTGAGVLLLLTGAGALWAGRRRART